MSRKKKKKKKRFCERTRDENICVTSVAKTKLNASQTNAVIFMCQLHGISIFTIALCFVLRANIVALKQKSKCGSSFAACTESLCEFLSSRNALSDPDVDAHRVAHR